MQAYKATQTAPRLQRQRDPKSRSVSNYPSYQKSWKIGNNATTLSGTPGLLSSEINRERSMLKSRFVTLLLFLCLSGTDPASPQIREVEQVSILQLIVTPERYDGKRVQVEGFLHLEFEGNVLYLSESDYIHHLFKNGLWVTRNSIINERFQKLNSHYVIVIGVFDAGNKGHMSMNSGSLKDITAADAWPELIKVKR
jgi:hypothetical protein